MQIAVLHLTVYTAASLFLVSGYTDFAPSYTSKPRRAGKTESFLQLVRRAEQWVQSKKQSSIQLINVQTVDNSTLYKCSRDAQGEYLFHRKPMKGITLWLDDHWKHLFCGKRIHSSARTTQTQCWNCNVIILKTLSVLLLPGLKSLFRPFL